MMRKVWDRMIKAIIRGDRGQVQQFLAVMILLIIKTAEKTPHFNAGDESGS